MVFVDIIVYIIAAILIYSRYYIEPKCRNSFIYESNLSETPIVKVTDDRTDRDLLFILDTGSNISVIDKSYADIFYGYINEIKSNVNSISGSFDTIGDVDLKLRVNNKIINHKFEVSDISDIKKLFNENYNIDIAGLIGADLMYKQECVIDFKGKYLKL